jgi:hypothetical protein
MANAFGETLGEKAKAMGFERLVGALVMSAWNARRFYSDEVKACALIAKLQNDDRAQAREDVWASRARRSAPAVSLPDGFAGLRPVGGSGRRRARLRRHHW